MTSIRTDKEAVTEAPEAMGLPAGGQTVRAKVRLAGLWARRTHLGFRQGDNSTARGNQGWQSPREGRRFAQGGGSAVGHCADKKEEACAASRGVMGRGGGGTGSGTQQALHKYLMNKCCRQRAFPELLPATDSQCHSGEESGLRGGPSGSMGNLPGGTHEQIQGSGAMPASVLCWAAATNTAGPFPALIMAVLINCTTAASILLSFN